jgi:hypothetical protein
LAQILRLCLDVAHRLSTDSHLLRRKRHCPSASPRILRYRVHHLRLKMLRLRLRLRLPLYPTILATSLPQLHSSARRQSPRVCLFLPVLLLLHLEEAHQTARGHPLRPARRD